MLALAVVGGAALPRCLLLVVKRLVASDPIEA